MNAYVTLIIIIISLLFVLIPSVNDKKINVKEWYYNSNSHVMCLIVEDKTIKDLYFIDINGKWYNYPEGTIADTCYSKLCNKLLNIRKPM